MMEFIDTHSHLAMLNHDTLEKVLARAKEAGISKMISVSVDEKSWNANREIAEAHDHIYFTLGLHPHDSKDWSGLSGKIEPLYAGLKNKKKCVAIGEIGLDFFYKHSERDVQIQAFRDQLALAKKLDLPIVIHCRDAFDETYQNIREVGLSSRGGVMHCFTGNTEQAKAAIDLGLKISFSGILTFKNAVPIQEAARAIPPSEIVIETDCPFLAPIPLRGKPNEPSFLTHTASALASLKGMSLNLVAEVTTRNAVSLFGLSA